MEKSNYLITWFYAEPKEDESFYPSVGGNTSSPEFQEVYWKCVYDFYRSALLTQSDVKYLFITNVPNIPTRLGKVNLAQFFRDSDIEVARLDLTNKTPKDWSGAWRNQFYVFDILDYLSKIDGNFCILDSDCLLRKDLSPVFQDIEEHGIISYRIGYEPDHNINGISISQMRELYSQFYTPDEVGGGNQLDYKGGEFVGISSCMITPLLEEYRKLWPLNYMRYEQQAFKLTEEAHFLSTLYYRLGCTNNIADKYIKRMWTALQCDNVEKKDGNLPIWHLPAEKKYGFEKLFVWFADNEDITKEDYLRMSDRVIGVSGSRSIRALRRGKDKILKKKN